MMALLFLLWFGAMTLVWSGRRNWALAAFVVALGASALWFDHHVTSALEISL